MDGWDCPLSLTWPQQGDLLTCPAYVCIRTRQVTPSFSALGLQGKPTDWITYGHLKLGQIITVFYGRRAKTLTCLYIWLHLWTKCVSLAKSAGSDRRGQPQPWSQCSASVQGPWKSGAPHITGGVMSIVTSVLTQVLSRRGCEVRRLQTDSNYVSSFIAGTGFSGLQTRSVEWRGQTVSQQSWKVCISW